MGILDKLFGAIKTAAEQAKKEIENAANTLEGAAGKLEDAVETNASVWTNPCSRAPMVRTAATRAIGTMFRLSLISTTPALATANTLS